MSLLFNEGQGKIDENGHPPDRLSFSMDETRAVGRRQKRVINDPSR